MPLEVHTMTCPSRKEIAICLEGQLTAWRMEQIFRHVEGCARCQLVIEATDTSRDRSALLGCTDLPSIRDHATRNVDTACQKMIRNAAKLATGMCSERVESKRNVSPRDVPRTIRDYQLENIVGVGGMGTVYCAWHARLKRHVALKILSTTHSHSKHAVRHFLNEMAAVGRLNHPHIIRALDAGICDGVHYLAMDLVDGLDVGEVLQRLGRLAVADAAKITAEIAVALEYAHSCGLVHRDIKPSNIMLASAGKALLLDLGLALLTESIGCGQGPPHVLGSLHYLAPEQAIDSRNVDAQADVYGLGCTLYHLLAGHPPFVADPEFSDRELLAAHADCQPPSLTATRCDIPPEIVLLVDRMLHKSPINRPSAQQVSSTLAPFADEANLPLVVRRACQITTAGQPAYCYSRPVQHWPKATNRAAWRLKVLVGLLGLLAGIHLTSWSVWQRSPHFPKSVVSRKAPRIGQQTKQGLATLLTTEATAPQSCLISSTIVALNESENKIYTIQDKPGSQLHIEITSASDEDKSTVTYQAWDYLELMRKYPELYDKVAWTWACKTNPTEPLKGDGWQVISRATLRSINGGKSRFVDGWTSDGHLQAAQSHRGNIVLRHTGETGKPDVTFARSINDLQQQFPEAAASLEVLEDTLLPVADRTSECHRSDPLIVTEAKRPSRRRLRRRSAAFGGLHPAKLFGF